MCFTAVFSCPIISELGNISVISNINDKPQRLIVVSGYCACLRIVIERLLGADCGTTPESLFCSSN